MSSPKYPLHPLAQLRRENVEQASRDLAAAVSRRESTGSAREAAERRRDDHDQVAAATRDAERDALARGELRVADLAQADGWAARVGSERQALASGVDRARAAEAQASRDEGHARAAVALRRAEAEVVARHHARWDDARRESLEAKEEEAASEAWRPCH